MQFRSFIPLSLVVAAILAFAPSRAHAQQVPADLEAAIHLKVLSFDSGLKTKGTKDTIVIGVLHGADKDSTANATAIANAFVVLADKKKVLVHGKKVRVVTIAIGADLDQKLADVGAAYASNNLLADHLAAVAKVAEARKVRTMGGSRGYLSNGIAVAVVAKQGKPAIIVHAGNAKRTGMVLDSKLLRLAEVIK